MWGRRLPEKVCNHGLRNTPTHVGKTKIKLPNYKAIRKHPHACGEDVPVAHALKDDTETPPRMWGRRAVNKGNKCLFRNTPTHVGKTCFMDIADTCPQETPPRMWGRLVSWT